ncbi:MAG: histidine phosphatase family protein [Armatimonadetes bacterium]|nr:histidine phosphatase family protein [Armatimonadota bacterium]
MEELIVVRHGEAEHMVRGLTGGWTDTPLTKLGKRQAQLTGPRIRSLVGNKKFAFYSSDLLRAAETAQIIGESLQIEPILTPALRELNNGTAAGLKIEDASKILNPITGALVDWAPFPGAETWRQMSERVESFLDRIRDDNSELVVLVAHGGSANAAICWWLELTIGRHNISFELDPCSISRLNKTRYGEKNVVKTNDTSHLVALQPNSDIDN